MIDKKIELIEISDLQQLIDNSVSESKYIEYKRDLKINTGDERKEFLADVSSFANANGGYILFGIEEDSVTKLPNSLCPFDYKNDDELIRQIESMLQDSISPRIPDIQIRLLEAEHGKGILLIQIEPSYMSPHRVIHKGHDKFYTRNSKGKYPMDIDELRQAFTYADKLNQQIETYKLDRCSAIAANRYSLLRDDYPIFIIQSIPLSAFRNKNILSVKQIELAVSKFKNFNAYYEQIVIDGIMFKDADQKKSFVHYKTNGILEKCTSRYFNPNFNGKKFIYGKAFIESVIEEMNSMLEYYKRIDISTPIVLSCSIMNGLGYSISEYDDEYGEIDRDALLIPDVIINDSSVPAEIILKPVFDAIWNACGYTHCNAYDDDNVYKGL